MIKNAGSELQGASNKLVVCVVCGGVVGGVGGRGGEAEGGMIVLCEMQLSGEESGWSGTSVKRCCCPSRALNAFKLSVRIQTAKAVVMSCCPQHDNTMIISPINTRTRRTVDHSSGRRVLVLRVNVVFVLSY